MQVSAASYTASSHRNLDSLVSRLALAMHCKRARNPFTLDQQIAAGPSTLAGLQVLDSIKAGHVDNIAAAACSAIMI